MMAMSVELISCSKANDEGPDEEKASNSGSDDDNNGDETYESLKRIFRHRSIIVIIVGTYQSNQMS